MVLANRSGLLAGVESKEKRGRNFMEDWNLGGEMRGRGEEKCADKLQDVWKKIKWWVG